MLGLDQATDDLRVDGASRLDLLAGVVEVRPVNGHDLVEAELLEVEGVLLPDPLPVLVHVVGQDGDGEVVPGVPLDYGLAPGEGDAKGCRRRSG